jgi:aspartyl-tRNA(Asn)/glutamyl-tRNA(Gln) amidotransferase subunit A
MLGDGPAARAFADLAAPDGDAPLAGVRVARLAADQYPLAVEPAVAAAVDAAVQVLQALGATVRERRLPFAFDDLMRRNGQLIGAEAWAVHRAYIEDERLPVGAGVRRRVLGGKAISAADYIDTLAHRRAACREWIAWMDASDALVTPTVPMAATPLDAVDESVTPMASFTRAGNYLDACGLSLPAGLTDAGLPLGIQLLGRSGTDAALLRIGIAFQRATDWHRRTPDLAPLLQDRS